MPYLSNPKYVNQKISLFRGGNGLFGTLSQALHPVHSSWHCLETSVIDTQAAPTTACQTQDENPCVSMKLFRAARGLNAMMADA